MSTFAAQLTLAGVVLPAQVRFLTEKLVLLEARLTGWREGDACPLQVVLSASPEGQTVARFTATLLAVESEGCYRVAVQSHGRLRRLAAGSI